MLDSLGRAYLTAMKVVLGLLSLALLAIAGWGVFSRNILDRSVVWADTTNTWIFVWIIFLGSALAVYRGAHMEVGAARDAMPPVVQKLLMLVGYAAVAAASAFLTYAGFKFLEVSGDTPSPATGTDLKWVLWAFPVGGVLMTLTAVERLVRALFVPADEYVQRLRQARESAVEEGL
ncbi:MAG TPA: TRAP transporter small permease [Vulgatibacteraceae bacterium]|nr:TRAP transporter small permease [Vulgatibacteraceae bacterium]